MDTREKLIEQKVKIGEESICHKCIHNGICIGEANQPCIECDRFLDSNGVTVQENCKDCAEATQNCIVKLQAQIAELRSVQEWISVKERFPEEEGLYLVAVVNDHERRYSKTAWYHGHGNWFLHQKVTHWMPLPPATEDMK